MPILFMQIVAVVFSLKMNIKTDIVKGTMDIRLNECSVFIIDNIVIIVQ